MYKFERYRQLGLADFNQSVGLKTSLLVAFRKHLTDDILGEINEMIIAYNIPDDPTPGRGSNPDTTETNTAENNGTLVVRSYIVGEANRTLIPRQKWLVFY